MADSHDHMGDDDVGRAFAWALALNLGFVLIGAGFGIAANSLALVADAAHNLTDVLGLLIAWGAEHVARRRPTARHTYGLGRATILAALANGVTILAGAGAIAWEALRRVADPIPVAASTVLWVAAVGVPVNLISALLFLKGRGRDLNLRGVFLHMIGDAAVSAEVVVAAVVILVSGWVIVNSIAAILVSLAVGWSAFDLLKSAIHLSLDGVPATIDTAAIVQWLRSQPGVADVHDLHVWPLSTTATALTVHLVMTSGPIAAGFLDQVADTLRREFDIAHTTIQIEAPDDPPCRSASVEAQGLASR